MPRSIQILTAGAVSIVALASACSQSLANHGPVNLSIVGTSDVHGGVLARDGQGGLSLLDGYVRNLRAARAADGGGVLLIDAGDLFQGTLESNLNEGAVVVSAYNVMGYTASAVGNHEFDFGPTGPAATPQTVDDDPRGALKARAAEARFPFLAANIVDEDTGRPVELPNVKPSTIVTVAGVNVGIVGLTTIAAFSATMSANTRGLAVRPLAPALEAEATKLRAAGATVVVATAHAGGRCTRFDNPLDLSSCDLDAEIFKVARALPPGLVDVIVAGHRHEGIAHEVAGVAIMSSYLSGRAFGRVDLAVDRATGRVQSRHLFPPHDVCAKSDATTGKCVTLESINGVATQYEGRMVSSNADIDAIFAPAIARVRELKEMPLGTTIEDMMPDLGPPEESALGNLLADWARATVPGADLGIVGGGGLRADLPRGPLTYGRLYEVTPFDNRHAVITVSGRELKTMVADNLGRPGSLMMLSGVRATGRCDGAEIRVTLQRDSGAPIRDDETLTTVLDEFLATGGDGFLTPIMPLATPPRMDGSLMRDRIAEWVKRRGGSWRSADLFDPANRRVVFPGSRPVTCEAR